MSVCGRSFPQFGSTRGGWEARFTPSNVQPLCATCYRGTAATGAPRGHDSPSSSHDVGPGATLVGGWGASQLTPTVALVTNVEWEHVDVYENAAAVAEAFAAFASRTRPGGALVLCADDPGARALLDAAPSGVRLVTYGTHLPPKLDACSRRRRSRWARKRPAGATGSNRRVTGCLSCGSLTSILQNKARNPASRPDHHCSVGWSGTSRMESQRRRGSALVGPPRDASRGGDDDVRQRDVHEREVLRVV